MRLDKRRIDDVELMFIKWILEQQYFAKWIIFDTVLRINICISSVITEYIRDFSISNIYRSSLNDN